MYLSTCTVLNLEREKGDRVITREAKSDNCVGTN